MSDNSINGNDQGNLVGELISEMQRTNPPHVFSVDNNGNQLGSAQGQSGVNNPSQQNSTPQQNGQPQAPINPQLQQQFMFVLQQNPQLQQMFQNPQALQQVLQNPAAMMNLISQHQQMQAVQNNQPNMQAMEQMQRETPELEEEEEDDDEDVNPDQMMNLQGPVQYEEDLEDIDVTQNSTNQPNDNKSFMEKLINDLKSPLIATILFIIFMQPFFREFIIKMIPQIQNSYILQIIIMASMFFTLNYSTKKLLDMFLP